MTEMLQCKHCPAGWLVDSMADRRTGLTIIRAAAHLRDVHGDEEAAVALERQVMEVNAYNDEMRRQQE